MRGLILIGGGGHCISCIDVIESAKIFKIEGILDREEYIGNSVLGYPIIGTDAEIENLVAQGNHFLITIGQLTAPSVRVKLYQLLSGLNANMPHIISKLSYVSEHAEILDGTIIMHHAMVNGS